MQKPVFPHCQTNPQSDLSPTPFQSHFLLESLWAQSLQNPLFLLRVEFISLLAGRRGTTNTAIVGTDLRSSNKLILTQLKTDEDLVDMGWVKSKPGHVWWQQTGANTACFQHIWVKPALQDDLTLRIRSKHFPPAAHLLLVTASFWILFLHADMWVVIGQFGSGKFKPLLSNTILITHSSTSAVQPSFLALFLLHLVCYKISWIFRWFVFLSPWHSPCRCSLGVHISWL